MIPVHDSVGGGQARRGRPGVSPLAIDRRPSGAESHETSMTTFTLKRAARPSRWRPSAVAGRDRALGHDEVLRPAGLPGQAPDAPGRLFRGRGRGRRRAGDPRRRGTGQVDRPGHDARPHQRRRQRRHAPGRLHEGRHHRGDRRRLRLGRRRDDRRLHPHPRQRRRPGRGGLPGQPLGDEAAAPSSSRARRAWKSECGCGEESSPCAAV